MAYTKQTWTNDVTAITAERMTHIEQGIYDNSLGIDKINPSGTATTTTEIEEGQISDVIGFKSLKLKGQTSQYTTTGSQLFDLSNTNVDTQYNYNNGFKLTKSTNRTREITLRTPIPSGNYYISADVINSTLSNNNQMYVTFKGANNTNVLENVRFLNNGAVTINAEVVSLYFFVANSEADTATITLDNIMLNSGSTRKNFEKYTGGKASPNPDFPQDVNNVSGDNVVGISNKNIARLELEGKIRSYANGNQYTTSGFNGYIASVKPNTTYVSSCQNISTQYTEISNLCYFDDNMNFLSGNVYNGRNKTFTTPANCKYVSIAVNQAIVNFQLEQNPSATSYTAHQGNNFEINLGKNLFNKENIIEGKRLSNDPQNQLADAEGYYTSSFIKVNPNTTYTKNSPLADAFHRFAFYSSNSESGYLSISNANTIVTPSECEYVRFSGGIDELDTSQLEKGAIATLYAPYFTPIEICKIGNYQDYIYKKDGKWYKYKAIEKVVLDGSETWTYQSSYPRFYMSLANPALSTARDSSKSTHFIYGNTETVNYTFFISSANLLLIRNESISSANDFKTWLASNNVTIYYVLATPIEEEITYTPLIRQLDEIYNSGLYDVTNISQDNSSEAFVLDLEACKNNINGIVEYIRR